MRDRVTTTGRGVVVGGAAAAALAVAGMGTAELVASGPLLGMAMAQGLVLAGGVAALLWRWQPAVLEAVGTVVDR